MSVILSDSNICKINIQYDTHYLSDLLGPIYR